ncbi:MAG: T9SS type A sorting domain-containing protein [Candidatus Cloacimonetes bacterium]|nr:T9SS type A sorting domain-containing protein [Candidatus Cloacimonadota bacterium]MBS3767852.1 T9SS type A sorting domain-containing protein [Candidatus Cloacimonadota bacterium]
MKKFLVITFMSLFLISSSAYALTIYDIQHTTDPGGDDTYPSTYEDQEVTTTGIVTAIGFKGYKDNFWMSMPEGGAWKGIYVYMSGDTTLVPGDEVEVTGTVTEYYGFTELTYVNTTLLSSGNPVPEPTTVTCGELMASVTAEPYEGTLVELNNVTVIQEQNDYGEWYVDDGTGIAQIDDGFFYLDSVTPPIVIEVGQQWETIIGCLDYSYDEYGVNPRTPDDMVEVDAVDVNPNSSILSINNSPNPFFLNTDISFSLKYPENVTIEIYNLLGQKITTLANGNFSADTHIIKWDGTDAEGQTVADGVYFYKLSTPENSISHKMLKVK